MITLNSDNFDELKESGIFIADFSSNSCMPCKMIAPILDDLATKYPNIKIGKVDIDKNMVLASKNNINALPTLLFFKEGELKKTMVGMVQKKGLIDIIEELLKVAS